MLKETALFYQPENCEDFDSPSFCLYLDKEFCKKELEMSDNDRILELPFSDVEEPTIIAEDIKALAIYCFENMYLPEGMDETKTVWCLGCETVLITFRGNQLITDYYNGTYYKEEDLKDLPLEEGLIYEKQLNGEVYLLSM